MPRAYIAGVPIDCISLDDAVDLVTTPAQESRTIHLCNAWTVASAQEHSSHLSALRRGTINLPDGAPVAWLAGWLALGKPAGAVPGPALMRAVFRRAQHTRHYLYGATDNLLLDLREALSREYLNVQLVGSSSPPMGEPTESWAQDLATRLRDVRADVVWVGLGTPKQDVFLPTIASLCNATYVAVGAAFDFISGNKQEAPSWLRGSGLEWIYRLATEPRRLGRRYLVGNTRFLRLAVAEWRCRTRELGKY